MAVTRFSSGPLAAGSRLRSRPLVGRAGRFLRPLWLLAPALVLILVFLVYPLVGVVFRSLNPQGLLSYSHPAFNLVNYKGLWTDPASRVILRNTFVIAVIAAAAAVAVAYPTAVFLTRLPPRWARVLLLFALFPFWTSIVVRVYALQVIMQKIGLLYTNTATVIGMVAYLLPYLIIIFYGGMIGIDDDLLRAARTLGARPARAFWHVFVPLSRPAVLSGALLVFIIGLGFFITPALLGAPSGTTVAMYIQQQVNFGLWGTASAMGTALLVVALIAYYFFDRIFGIDKIAGGGAQIRREDHRAPEGSLAVRIGLGSWSMVAFAFLLLPLLAVVLISFSNQSYLTLPPQGFSLRWYRALFSDPSWASSAWLSLRVALLTTVFATVSGLLASVVLARNSFRGKGLLRALFLLPLIVPVVLIAAAVFDLESRLHIVGSVLGYALGHTVLAIPFVVIICSSALAQLGTSLEEASRSLGAGWLTTFRKITLPLILPSILTAAAIAFVASWDEPVMSLFLQGLTPTLPVHIFTFVKQSVEPTVAALSTLILAGLLLIAGALALVNRLVKARAAARDRHEYVSGAV
jgi:putative spermidine/putrescine transport system permease protein